MLETEKSNPLRVGFFGGTFDPPHNGHLAIANQAIDKAGLDLLFAPPIMPHFGINNPYSLVRFA